MPAFTYSRHEQIRSIIKVLGTRLVNNIKNDVTVNDVFECYVMPEHRKTLTEIFSLVSLNQSASVFQHRFDIGKEEGILTLSLSFRSDDVKFLLPNYAANGMLPNAPAESVKRIQRWAAKRIAIGREMGQAYDVFNTIVDRCSSAKAVAFLMPSVKGLIGLIEDDESARLLHDKLTRTGLPPLPGLEPELRHLAKTTGETFVRAMLLDRTFETAKEVPVALNLHDVTKVKNVWGTTQTFL